MYFKAFPGAETFYFSKVQKSFSLMIGILICLLATARLYKLFTLDREQVLLWPIILLTTLSLLSLGLVFILLSLGRKREAIGTSLIAILFAAVEIFLDTFLFPETDLISVGIKFWGIFSSSLALLSLATAVLLISLLPLKQLFLWITIILAGLNFGYALFIMVSYVSGLGHLLFRVDTSLLVAFAVTLVTIGVLTEALSFFAAFYPRVFGGSIATIWGTAALLLTISTWSAFQIRERQLISEISEERATTLQESIEIRGSAAIFALSRMKERWIHLKDDHEEDLHQIDALLYLEYFPWVEEIGFVKDGVVIDTILSKLPSGLLQTLIQEIPYSAEEFEIPRIIFKKADDRVYMIVYYGYDEKESSHLFSVSDALQYFTYLVPNFLRKENGILIYSQNDLLFQVNQEEIAYKDRFSSSLSFMFHQARISIEIWPIPAYIEKITSPASTYHLIIGIILSLTIFFALYFAYLATKKKKEAYEANKEKSMFLANMSHEIRTPLNGIIGSCSILEITQLQEDQKKWVAGIKKSGKALLELIDDILDISKIETAGMKISYAEIDLKQLLEETMGFLTQKAKAKNLELFFEYDPDLAPIQIVDGKRVRQIVVNLVDNGIKYTREGYVKLSLFESNGFIVFRVEDSGRGIAEHDMDKLFKKYIRLDIRAEEGSGLGLALVKKLLEKMNGSIEVKSATGRGSVFTARLPIIKKEEIRNQE
ncbi:MAG: hypothetical protein JJU12_04065 [Chlamydiales bacterium]|nr:hypothetical protein [Chlamydiales bacterium]